jgi:Aspartyl/Asparaginyl beta-hydroxylase
LDAINFPSVAAFEEHWQLVRSEIGALLQQHRENLPRLQDISPDQKRISPDDKWRTFFLYGFGSRLEQNCGLCPQTRACSRRCRRSRWRSSRSLRPARSSRASRNHQGSHPLPPRHRRSANARAVLHGHRRCPLYLAGAQGPAVRRHLSAYGAQPHRPGADSPPCFRRSAAAEQLSMSARFLRGAMLWRFRRTAYVRDARRNQAIWEERTCPEC